MKAGKLKKKYIKKEMQDYVGVIAINEEEMISWHVHDEEKLPKEGDVEVMFHPRRELVEKKDKFEIINPSDKAFIYGDFKTVCVATFLSLGPQYGLREVDGEKGMPLTLFGVWKDWFPKTFGKRVEELAREVGREKVKEALKSAELEGERSSLNDFTSKMHNMAEIIEDKSDEEFFEIVDGMVSGDEKDD